MEHRFLEWERDMRDSGWQGPSLQECRWPWGGRHGAVHICFGHQGPVAQVGQSHEFRSSPRLHGGCSLFGSRATRPPSPPPGSCTPDPHPGPAPGVRMGLRLDHFSVAFLGGSHGSQRGSAAQGEDSRWKETRAGTVEGDGSRFGWYLGPQL